MKAEPLSPPPDPRPLVILLGPTASGKSALAAHLAERFGGEMVGADSRQLYRGMAVGTSQPSADLRSRVPHHLVDFLEPSERFSAARFARMAREAVEGIYSRGRLPLVAGGSGLYIRALAEGLFEDEGADPALREELTEFALREGRETLHARLAREDPEAASSIHPRDLKRVVRALELRRRWGLPLREVRRGFSLRPFEEPLYLGLAWPRDVLYGRIDRRAAAMWEGGLLGETEALLRRGLACAPALEGLGYRHVGAYLRGELGREEALRLLQRDHRRYAKRQLTWFRALAGVGWLDAAGLGEEGLREEAARRVAAYLARRPRPPGRSRSTDPERCRPLWWGPPCRGGLRGVGSSPGAAWPPPSAGDRMNIVLVGFKGCGKTAVGRRLASLLGRPFVDLDGRIEEFHAAETGRTAGGRRRASVREIYRERGEEGFRRLEARALEGALREDGVVLAAGGGAPFCCPEAEGWLRSHFVIYLRVGEGELYRRVEAGGFPPFLTGEDPRGALARLLRERAPTYESIARLVVDNEGRSPGATAEAILPHVRKALGGA